MKKLLSITTLVALFAISSFGATNDVALGGSSGYANTDGAVLFSRTLDFSKTTLTGTSADIYQSINIPAGTFVSMVGYQVLENSAGLTGEDSTCTIDIGDSTDRDGWVDGANVLTGQVATAYINVSELTSVTLTNGAGVAYVTGKLFKTADTIDLLLNNAAGTLKIKLFAIGNPVLGL